MDTYWDNKGRYQALLDKLNKLVPVSGPVPDPKKNKNLERFRKASNAYYDIFNNGAYNRGRSIARIFRINLSRFKNCKGHITDWDGIHKVVEPVMDQIVLDAALEQISDGKTGSSTFSE